MHPALAWLSIAARAPAANRASARDSYRLPPHKTDVESFRGASPFERIAASYLNCGPIVSPSALGPEPFLRLVSDSLIGANRL
jgi:hypothetical protein